MDRQLNMDPLEKAFEESGYDLDMAIKKLTDLRLDSAEQSACSVSHQQVAQETTNENLPEDEDGVDLVEFLVGEMMSASDIDDAKSRASALLQLFENAVHAHASQSFHQESEALKGKVEALVEENQILKRAVVVQYERLKGFRNTKSELANLKKLVTRYHNQLRTLERKNYALTLQLKQALNGDSIPGQFRQKHG